MATVKRISGDYVIKTINTGDVVEILTTNMTVDVNSFVIDGDLTVTGNASLTGNIAADNIFNGTTSVTIPSPGSNVNININGTPDIAVFSTAGANVTGYITATGNLTGANVNTAGLITATGNISGANINTAGNVWISRDASTAQPTIRFTDTDVSVADGQVLGAVEWFTNNSVGGGPRVTAAVRTVASSTLGNASVQILTSTAGAAATTKVTVLSTGNVGVGNTAPVHLFTVQGTMYGSSTFTAVGNITGGNLITAGQVSATANVTGGNVITGGLITATGNINGGNIISGGFLGAGTAGISTVGNITGGNLNIDTRISATGNVLGDSIIAATGFSTVGNLTVDNINLGGNIVDTGAISIITAASGNVSLAPNGVNAVVATTAGANITGALAVTGNITGANVTTAGLISATGNITGGNVNTGILSLTGNILGAVNTVGTITTTANISGGNVNTTNLSLTGNVLSDINSISNINTTGNITAGNVSIRQSFGGPGINVDNLVLQTTDYELSLATPEPIGSLQFIALANQVYKFQAYVVLIPSGSTAVAPAVNFPAGDCVYTTEIQTTATSALNIATKTTSDNVSTTYNSTGTDARTLRVTGLFSHTANTTVSLSFQTSIANVTASSGSYLVYTRTA